MKTLNATLNDTLKATLISPNTLDSNLEPANVVDGLFAIARAINIHAERVQYVGDVLQQLGKVDGREPEGGFEFLGGQLEKAAEIIAEAMTKERR